MLHVAPGRHRVTTGGFVIDHSNIMSSNLGSVHLHLRLPQPYLSFITEIQIFHRINTNRIILKAKLPTAVKKYVSVTHISYHSSHHFQYLKFVFSSQAIHNCCILIPQYLELFLSFYHSILKHSTI